MWWHRLIDRTSTEDITIPEVPDDIGDALRLRAYTETAMQHVGEQQDRVDNVVGSLGGARLRNHFSQMAIESMARIKE